MLYLILKFIHLIAAMVYFGLPFAFGRWFASCLHGEDRAALADALDKMKRFALLHMNAACLLILGTGIWLGLQSAQIQAAWLVSALVLTLLTLINLNAHLVPVLARHRRRLEVGGDRAVRTHIAVFSAVHHSLITAAAALMVFRPA